MDYSKLLNEASIPVDMSYFRYLTEAQKAEMTDSALTELMKLIVDKYNSLDFSEIEKSAGDITRFKYTNMMKDNMETLYMVYKNSSDTGAAKYMEVLDDVGAILSFLQTNRKDFNELYKEGNGIIQLLYTSLVSSCVYCMHHLVSNTIRFVTVDNTASCEVMFDEIPGSIKHVHIRNVKSGADSLNDIRKLLTAYKRDQGKGQLHESVTLTVGAAVVIGVVVLLPRLIHLIREIIYSIYFARVRVSDALDVQAKLIRTNIESLESTGRGKENKKIIARQKKIAEALEVWKNRIAIKSDTTEYHMNKQIQKEEAQLKIDSDTFYDTSYDSGLMI